MIIIDAVINEPRYPCRCGTPSQLTVRLDPQRRIKDMERSLPLPPKPDLLQLCSQCEQDLFDLLRERQIQ